MVMMRQKAYEGEVMVGCVFIASPRCLVRLQSNCGHALSHSQEQALVIGCEMVSKPCAKVCGSLFCYQSSVTM